MTEEYYVYILTNKGNTVLYTGVTNDLARRVMEHKEGLREGFTRKYRVHRLVFFEAYESIQDAICREKQIKGGSRAKKINLINSLNPNWEDLYETL